MVVGSYLITGTHMRIKDENGSKYIGLNGPPPTKGRLTPSSAKERAELVFQLVPKKMKKLILVNSALSEFDMIQACVETAEKHSDNVMVIPSLLALLTFALGELSKFRNPPPKEVVLVVIITTQFIDFIILRRDQNFVMYVDEYEHFETLNGSKEKFLKIYNYCYPHSTNIIVYESLYNIAEDIQNEYNPENCFIKTFEKWDYILLFGGMLRAMDDRDGFDTRYHIENFTHGFETTVQNRQTFKHEKHILLPARSSLPCNIYGFNGNHPGKIVISYSSEFCQFNKELILTKRDASRSAIFTSGSSKEIIGYIDERGIPFVKDSAEFINRELPKNTKADEQTSRKQDSNENNQISSASEPTVSSQLSSSSINDPPQIRFIFRDNFYGIEVFQNGSSKFLTDSSGNKWTPLYFSMAESIAKIGTEAKTHYSSFTKHVIYDIFEVIGKPLNEIRINPKWGFKLIEKDGIVYFYIETFFGPRLFSQEIIFAAFLKTMKFQTESNLNTQINEIHLSTHLKLTESQKNIFIKAAAKNNIEILSFNII